HDLLARQGARRRARQGERRAGGRRAQPPAPGPRRRHRGVSDAAGPGSDTVPWRTFVTEATERLRAAALASPEGDARRIVERASGAEGAEYHAALDQPAGRRAVGFFDAMLARREAGEPLQYVLGEWSFRTLDLLVDRRVLIPRPETEVVAEVALAELD